MGKFRRRLTACRQLCIALAGYLSGDVMLFCEPFFLFAYLPASLFVYYASPARLKNAVLLLFSCIFYAAGEPHFLLWLAASVCFNYIIARSLQSAPKRYRKLLLCIGVASDLALLIVCKYTDFILTNVNAVLGLIGHQIFPLPHLALPLGISFFTFHKISYKVDVYRDGKGSGRSFSELCLYIMLYPQLLAGPIIRYSEIRAQLKCRVHPSSHILKGMRRFVLGLTKKLFVANAMGLCADQIFGISGTIDGVPIEQLSVAVAWFGALAYTLQIYFDFSGYSDMAIGLGGMYGFTFPENFNYPYIASSVTDFWRRWHMSLSRWFRDYLYIPLGGNRLGPGRLYCNLLAVFLLCGLWHGASWNFVVWGLWHGGLLVAERLYYPNLDTPLKKVLGHAYTLFAIIIGWVFFRADTLASAFAYLRVMLFASPTRALEAYHQPLSWWLDDYCIAALAAGLLGSTPWWMLWRRAVLQRTPKTKQTGQQVGFALQLSACLGLLVFSAMIISAGAYSPFIYFRF